jgi:peptidoglycan hydrolase CwlO-like protein
MKKEVRRQQREIYQSKIKDFNDKNEGIKSHVISITEEITQNKNEINALNKKIAKLKNKRRMNTFQYSFID